MNNDFWVTRDAIANDLCCLNLLPRHTRYKYNLLHIH